MRKWQLKRLEIPLTMRITTTKLNLRVGSADIDWLIPIPDEKTEEIWDEASELALDGWELVSAVPIIRGHEIHYSDISRGSSYTQGYTLLFKREILE